ncbi:MAG: M14 family metallopeptidase [Planctomycetota bacterium]
MRQNLLVAALLAGIPCGAIAQTAPTTAQPVRSLIEVTVRGPAQLRQLLALDLDLAACTLPLPGQRRIEVIGFPGDVAILQQAGIAHRVLVPDLAAAHAQALAAVAPAGFPDTLNPAIGQGAMGGHYTLAQMEAILDSFAAQYPGLCSVKASIGSTIESRPIWMVKISDNVGIDESEPEVLFDAVHHAREPLSMGATLLFMDELLSGYGTDPEATFLIDQRELFFVPCLNPDGYEYNRSTNPNGGGMWRKNRRQNTGGSYGVDLNRNYATAWNAPNGGSSTSPTSDTYRGTGPFSEPETTAIEAFAAARQFAVVSTTHTYTDVLLRPWGWQNGNPANVAEYNQLGGWMVQESGIAHGSISAMLYIASGSSVDHHHTVRGSRTFSAELGRSNEGGFWPVGAKIEEIARRHQPMLRKTALSAGAAFAFTAVNASEAPGGNGNGIVEPGEAAYVNVSVQNLGVAGAALTIDLLPIDPQLLLAPSTAALGPIAALAPASNGAGTLGFQVPVGFPGDVAHLRVRISGDGRTQDRVLEVGVAGVRTCVDDDFETDRGFTRGANTATGGLWERAAPSATSLSGVPMQPGTQTTPGGTFCLVTDGRPGTTADTYDVDAGYTDIRSPVLDLQHVAAASVKFDLWYAESTATDALLVQLSRDGGVSWTTLLSRTTPTTAWLPVELALPPPLTAQMVLRVRAQDQAPASTVEALVDQFQVRGAVSPGGVTLLGSGGLGSSLRLGMNGPNGAWLLPIGALALGPGLSVPGIAGTFLLDPLTVGTFPLQILGASGYAAIDVGVPNQPGLIGATIAFQGLVVTGAGIGFGGNSQQVVLN